MGADLLRRVRRATHQAGADQGHRGVRRLRELAARSGCTPAQLALAWVMARGDDVVPIPGTTRCARLEENVGALEVRLSAEDLAAIDEIAPLNAASGDRYPKALMHLVNR
ncbi:MAG: aldo/keto reductase [Candidatus Riflebacteria bacterium]|nr:aldo/keto reductase [Candidatus Riflebacteria bacterium]